MMDRYQDLTKRLRALHLGEPQLASIGKSVEGRDIWALRLGQGRRRVLFTGALHGREWIATEILLRLSEQLAHEFSYSNLTLAVVPMLNPDGVVAAARQTDRVHKSRQKSNARGVDLNRNFDADWKGAGIDPEPSFTDGNYPGEAPFSEPETAVIRDLVEEFDPEVVADWHFRGGLLDIEHGGPRGRELAELLAGESGYEIVEGMHYASSGTFAAWLRRGHPERSVVTVEIRHGELEEDWPELGPAITKLLERLDRA